LFCVAGAGFSGAVIARELARAGHRVSVMERRSHVAGNCHTLRDPQSGILLHQYGPHIFHTADAEVWDYVRQFSEFMPFNHRVRAMAKGRIYSLPINLLTINQFFGKTFSPDEARYFIEGLCEVTAQDPCSFEEQALALVGRELYEAFFKGYTEKQWGCSPTQIPASILKRLPLRYDYNDGYFAHPFQGMPKEGYTALIERMLDHPLISVALDSPFEASSCARYEHVFYSGPLDGYFSYSLGRLAYRTLDFEMFRAQGDYQGCAVMNYCDADVPFTRITEHKHFAPWEEHADTICFREYSRHCEEGDTPFYPVHRVGGDLLLQQYQALAAAESNVTFVGRLGTYQYLDMDRCIRLALDTVRKSGLVAAA